MSVLSTIHQISNLSQLHRPPSKKTNKLRVLGSGPSLVFPYGYLDGASTKNIGGFGICILLNESHSFEFALGAETCANTKAELIGLWALLHIAQLMGIPSLNILGDSSVIINWAKGTDNLSQPNLSHWCRDTKQLCTSFTHMSFSHIYREHNQLADSLSKTALSLAPGMGFYSELFEGLEVSHDNVKLF